VRHTTSEAVVSDGCWRTLFVKELRVVVIEVGLWVSVRSDQAFKGIGALKTMYLILLFAAKVCIDADSR